MAIIADRFERGIARLDASSFIEPITELSDLNQSAVISSASTAMETQSKKASVVKIDM